MEEIKTKQWGFLQEGTSFVCLFLPLSFKRNFSIQQTSRRKTKTKKSDTHTKLCSMHRKIIINK